MATRRNFLLTASAACAAAALPARLFAQGGTDDPFAAAYLGAYAQNSLSYATFSAVVGQSFRTTVDNARAVSLQLISATQNDVQTPVASAASAMPLVVSRTSALPLAKSARIPVQASLQHMESFDLTFASGDAPFEQGTYVLDHGTLGSFAVLLVPGAPASGRYTASFFYLSPAQQAANPAPTYQGPRGSLPVIGRPAPVTPVSVAAPVAAAAPPASLQATPVQELPVRMTPVRTRTATMRFLLPE